MSPMLTRRDVLTGAVGLGAGALLSPAPFKLLGDAAIWTQNWAWRPRARPGRIETRFTHCTRCDAACPLTVRTCDGRPVGVSPVTTRAPWQASPCGAGFLLHQLRFHPQRLLTAAARVRDHQGSLTLAPAAAVSLLADWLRAARHVGFLDGQPGRAQSELYRRLAAAAGGRYAALEGDAPWLTALSRAAGGTTFDVDLSRVRLLVSLGAPLADGFGAPDLVSRLRAARSRAERPLRVVHADAVASRTAMWADEWLPVVPGSEAALALGLTRELLGRPTPAPRALEDAGALRDAVEPFTPELVASLTGVAPQRLTALVDALVSSGPALVVAGNDAAGGPLGTAAEVAVAALAILTGAVAPDGPVRPRGADRPLATPPAELVREWPDHTLDLLVCDLEDAGRAVPAALVDRVLAPGGRLVVLTSSMATAARRADLALPRWLPFESHGDATPGATAPHAYVVATPFVAPPRGCPDGVELLARAGAQAARLPADEPLTTAARVQARTLALARAGVGELVTYAEGTPTPVARLAGHEALWSGLAEGGVWVDDPSPACRPLRFTLSRASREPLAELAVRTLARAGIAHDQPLTLVCSGWRGASSGTPQSPVITKALRDTRVREGADEVRVSPATARSRGLRDGARVRLETERGAVAVRVRVDPAVSDPVLLVAGSPTPEDLGEAREPTRRVLDLFDVDRDGSWRQQGARLVEV